MCWPERPFSLSFLAPTPFPPCWLCTGLSGHPTETNSLFGFPVSFALEGVLSLVKLGRIDPLVEFAFLTFVLNPLGCWLGSMKPAENSIRVIYWSIARLTA